jgi:hypothetical protein
MTGLKKSHSLAESIAKEKDQDLNGTLGYHSWVSLGHRYVCMTIPKVACTTVKTVLLCMEGELSPEVLAGKVHHPNRGTHLGGLDTPQVVEALSSPDWFRFSFVRNPYERLLSAYKSKLGNPNDSQYAWLRDEIRAEFDYPTREGTPATIAFRDLVAYLTRRPERA